MISNAYQGILETIREWFEIAVAEIEGVVGIEIRAEFLAEEDSP